MELVVETSRALRGGRAVAETPGMDRIAVSIPEATRISGISRSELYRLLGSGRLDARKSGRSTLIMVSSLRAFVESLPPAHIRTVA